MQLANATRIITCSCNKDAAVRDGTHQRQREQPGETLKRCIGLVQPMLKTMRRQRQQNSPHYLSTAHKLATPMRKPSQDGEGAFILKIKEERKQTNKNGALLDDFGSHLTNVVRENVLYLQTAGFSNITRGHTFSLHPFQRLKLRWTAAARRGIGTGGCSTARTRGSATA